MSRPKVYLAGPITGQTYAGATDWREGMRARLAPHIQAISPMRGKEYLAGLAGVIGGTPNEAYMRTAISSQRGIIGRDRNDVRTADVVLMNLLGAERVSIGTMIEMGWADAWRIPVVLVTPADDNIHDHVMLDGLATYHVHDLDAAEHLVRVLLDVPAKHAPAPPLQQVVTVFDRRLYEEVGIPMAPLPGGGL